MRYQDKPKRRQPKKTVARRSRRAYGHSVAATLPGLRVRTVPWTGSRVLALLGLLVVSGVLAWFFLDARFYIYGANVQGNSMLSATEVYQASQLDGMSTFYLDRAEVARRICEAIPGVTSVRVEYRWPSQVSILIREQDVRFVWHTQPGAAFLVDGAGLVLKLDSGSHPDLLDIRSLDAVQLKPGEHVERVALSAASALHSLLPQASAFDYSRLKGIQWVDEQGRRIFFGDDRRLDEKMACMRTLVAKIERDGSKAEFIDVRFVESPYYKERVDG